MEKERIINAPEGCKIEKVEIVDGAAVVTFKEKERKLPKSWEEFCDMFPNFKGEYFIEPEREEKIGQVVAVIDGQKRTSSNAELLPDRATAEAVLALCQLIQLRNAYNGDWVPDWNDDTQKHSIEFCRGEITKTAYYRCSCSPMYFKTEELRNEFLRNFRNLIEKLMPLYGIKEGEYINVEERGGKE